MSDPTVAPTAPPTLKKIQEWFGSIIGRPIDDRNRMNPISPSGRSMVKESTFYITPSPTLKPHQRIELYNQQYWWRLFRVIQEGFPLLLRLFGYYDFNQSIVVPYILCYPPVHWSIDFIGNRLPEWIQKFYQEVDKELVFFSALIDASYIQSFFAPQLTSAKDLPQEKLLSEKLTLQPHIHLFQMPYDLFTFRTAFLKEEPEYWEKNPFPPLPQDQTHFFILYRNLKNDILWNKLSQAEFQILNQIKQGTTIDALCEWMEQSESITEEARSQIQTWFSKWTYLEWLVPQENSP